MTSMALRWRGTAILPAAGIVAGMSELPSYRNGSDQASPWAALLFSSAIVLLVLWSST
jgi:hypothetical protein